MCPRAASSWPAESHELQHGELHNRPATADELQPRLAKILIGTEKLREDELDQKFTEVFVTMCAHEIPIWGFLNDEIGQWMCGPMECFLEVFSKQYVVFGFNADTYVEKAKTTYWVTQLNEREPMKSVLLKIGK